MSLNEQTKTLDHLTPLQQMYQVLTFHETRLSTIESKIDDLVEKLTLMSSSSTVEVENKEDSDTSSENNLEKDKSSKTKGKKAKHVKLEITE